MFPSFYEAPRCLRVWSVVTILGVASALVAGCDANARADPRNALTVKVQGTSEELYGVEVALEFDGEETILQPLGSDGRVVIPRAPAGNARITLRDLQRRFATLTVTVESPGEHELSLVAGTHFKTTIRGENDAALETAKVVAGGGGSEPLAFTLSGVDATFGPLPSGAFKLVVSSPGYRTRVVDLNVKRTRSAGTVRNLPDLRLEPGGSTLRGKLIVDSSVGQLSALLRHDGASQEIDLRPDGSFEVTGLSLANGGALQATLVVRNDGHELLARDLRIEGDLDLGRIPLR